MDEKTLLPIQPKVYEFSLWFHRVWLQFPKTYKYILGQQIADVQIEMMSTIAEARFIKNKLDLLRTAQRQLEKLRWLLRLAKDLQCISIKQYEQSSRYIVEIGKMLGGWERTQKIRDVESV